MDLLTTDELAALLRVSPETCRWWKWRGTGPRTQKVGSRVLYRREDVDAWLEAQRGPDPANA